MAEADLPDFETPQLAQAVEALRPDQIDALPYGAIRLDRELCVSFYSASERRLSGLRRSALGRDFFAEIAPCMDNPEFRGRIDRALAAGKLDLAFGYESDMPSGEQEVALDIRIQAASDGGLWIFLWRR